MLSKHVHPLMLHKACVQCEIYCYYLPFRRACYYFRFGLGAPRDKVPVAAFREACNTLKRQGRSDIAHTSFEHSRRGKYYNCIASVA